MADMKYFSMFSGVGGFELGIGDRGECVGYSEIDKYAILTYERHFGEASILSKVKTILSDNNYSKLELCYVNTAKQGQSSIKTTGLSARIALKDMKLNGEQKTVSTIETIRENLELCKDKKCLICTGADALAVEKRKSSSSPLSIKTVTDTLTEKNMGLGICIGLLPSHTNPKSTRYYATTVITLKGDTGYVHTRNKPHLNWGDATKINERELPDFDLLVGGFPCQAFSIAGKRRGFDEARGTLFFEIARVLKDKRPRHFLLENVKGLLSHDTGKTFQTILKVLSDLGYGVEWQLLNGKRYVPQNRERIIIIGHLRDECRGKIFPFSGSYGETQSTIHPALDANYYKGLPNQRRMINQLNQPTHSNDRVYADDGISPTLNTAQGGNRQPFVAPAQWRRTEKGKAFRREAQRNGRDLTPFNDGHRELVPKDDNVIGAITSQAIAKDSLLFENTRIRRLTPLECERLMGWEDNWTEGVSDTQRYKQCGNGIIAPMVDAVITAMCNEGCLQAEGIS